MDFGFSQHHLPILGVLLLLDCLKTRLERRIMEHEILSWKMYNRISSSRRLKTLLFSSKLMLFE